MFDETQLTLLRRYASGEAGTRETIEALGLADFGDIIIALAQHDLPFPPSSQAPHVVADRQRAWALLEPLLTRGA